MSASAASAARRKRAASNPSSGSTRSRQWCRTRSRSATVGLAVPMSRRRYACRESAETISAPMRSASSIASAVLPLAVGPTRQTMRGRLISPVEEPFELGPGERRGHGTSVGAVSHDLDAVHGDEERPHLRVVESLPYPDHAVTGDRRERAIGRPVRRHARPLVAQLGGHRAQERRHVLAGQRARCRAEEERPRAEWLPFETRSLEGGGVLGEGRDLRRRELDRLGYEQRVARYALRAPLRVQPLVDDPLVSGMLVDQHDASLAFAEE